ncbi:hypothetical protein EXU85_02450 [Spirosoma sp. KCTC 42546]|uniref:hypothetical protein n=1 Tax=Spirosoma sp. KCTC 42546 TaxID=2520506 RepID=UPI0011587EE0|nr:hypothetical protein [Spirosoma sp. KCTC 42546]QDK77518.1 hypothetical protein EXU85_02450 [Spirosoma sp. KCTC 42546]
MEFDELQKIWDSQTREPLWVINENALHKRILAKKNQAHHITTISELLLLFVNSIAGGLILGINFFKHSESLFLYIMAAWMFLTALYVLMSRFRRLKGENEFDRSMLGELNHAVSMATYQVHLSQLMRWNTLPIGILSLLSIWEGGKSVWLALGVLAFFALTYFASGWEHRVYTNKKRELESLQKKLEKEEITG